MWTDFHTKSIEDFCLTTLETIKIQFSAQHTVTANYSQCGACNGISSTSSCYKVLHYLSGGKVINPAGSHLDALN